MKPKKPKARVMWAQFPDLYMELSTYNVWGDGIPVLVLPLTDLPALQERVAKAMYCDDVGLRRGEPNWKNLASEHPENTICQTFRSRAIAALRAIHPSLAKK